MVFLAYRLLIHLAILLLAPFMRLHPRLKALKEGWRESKLQLQRFEADPTRPLWWFHCASLGEFEQAVPVMEALRDSIPGVRIAVSFFSPSGYRARKNTPLADLVFYLPPDTAANNTFLLHRLKPSAVVWVKYEFWFGYLRAFRKNQIPSFLLAATLRAGHFLTKFPGKLLFAEVAAFRHIFTQDVDSEARFKAAGAQRVTCTGDTRFDRVATTRQKAERIPVAEAFRQEDLLVIAGSSWPEEEELLEAFLRKHGLSGAKWLIVPHHVDGKHIDEICARFAFWGVARWSAYTPGDPGIHVLVVDRIGLLSSLYQYGDIAVIGGAFGKTGLHNILEAAVFGMPVVCGPNTAKFWEAEAGRVAGFVFQPNDQAAFISTMEALCGNEAARRKAATQAAQFCEERCGATGRVLSAMLAATKPH